MKIYKEFFKYVIPSMIAFALNGLYGIVDGFFLGNEMGDAALAAINIAYPITALMQAIGTGIGMGGAVQYTILKAQGRDKDKAVCLGLTLKLLSITGAVLTPVFILGNNYFLRLLGAGGELLVLGSEYISWIALGTMFQILGTGLVPFMRNMGGAMIPMVAMVMGSVLNITFDYFFIWVFPLGMRGAALASVMGQVGAFTVSLIYIIWTKEKIIWRGKGVSEGLPGKILMVGCSPFGLSFAPNITLILVNLSAMLHGGDFAVKAYAPISYISFTIMLLLQGVSDGCQPLVSNFYGKGDRVTAGKIYRMSRNFSFFVGILSFTFIHFFGRETVGIFGTSKEVAEYVVEVLPLLMMGMVFSAFSRSVTSYFYATEQNGKAYFMIYGEQLFLFICLLTLPVLAGITGTWASITLSQAIMAVVGLLMVTDNGKRRICKGKLSG